MSKYISGSVKTILAFVLLAATGTAVGAQSPSVTGEWDLTINSPQGSRTIKADFKQEGEKLTGLLKSQRGEVPIEGTVKGKEIKFSYPYKSDGLEFTITMTGAIEGASMQGKADFGGLAEGDWTANRGGAVAVTGQSGAPTVVTGRNDVTGAWEFQVETAQGSGSPTFTFKQDGETLTGQYKGTFGEAPLAGTVKGNKIEFSIKVSGQIDATITYSGLIDGATMKGTAKFGELGDATWTAKRK
jgi:hypothetical protein